MGFFTEHLERGYKTNNVGIRIIKLILGEWDRRSPSPLVLIITTLANEWEGGVEAENRII
jgi:hypothetical protein